ncbi:MAG: peptidylprolyl isomerase [Pseudoclavibacter sp.]
MASSKKTKEDRRRKREYEARVVVHDRQVKRTKRDNVVALITLGVVAVLAAGAQVFFFTGGPGGTVAETEDPSTTSSADATESPDATYPAQVAAVPSADIAVGRAWTGTMTFNDDVELGIELDGEAAPQAVSNMIALNEQSYFDDTACHRLTTEGLFVLQCGDPEGTGTGGPGYSWGPIENAPEDGVYPAGTIAMARVGNDGNSMGSQFFIVYEDTTLPADSAGGYTIMGQVTSGLDDLVAGIVDEGVEGGAGDGAPAAPAVITGLTLE